MSMLDLGHLSVSELLDLHSWILGELQDRKVIRSKNNPTGGYAEYLVSQTLGLVLVEKSAKGFDARHEPSQSTYQIKGRRATKGNGSTQLGIIRNLEDENFDFLVPVIFDENWTVSYAAKIPHRLVTSFAKKRDHVNGHVMRFNRSDSTKSGVEDITDLLQDVQRKLNMRSQ